MTLASLVSRNPLMSAPLTSELAECLENISEMTGRTGVLMAKYGEKAGVGQSVYADAQLFCENLESYLAEIFFNEHRSANREECNAYLAFIKEAADQAEDLAEKLSHDGASARLEEALKILAQALRFAMPPLLRWGHGYQGRQAGQTVEKLNFRLAKLIRKFSFSLTAA